MLARLPADATCFATAIVIWRRSASITDESLILFKGCLQPSQSLPITRERRDWPSTWQDGCPSTSFTQSEGIAEKESAKACRRSDGPTPGRRFVGSGR